MIENILNHYGAKGIVETSESIRSTCPIHGGSNPSSFSISKSGGLYTCFASGLVGT